LGLTGYRGYVTEQQGAGAAPAGTRQAARGATRGTGGDDYPGQQFGLPSSGPRSVAGMGRRFGALFIDWILCLLIAAALLRSPGWTIVVFGVESYVLTSLTGTTVGKRLLGLRVARLDGKPVGLLWGLVRTLLLLTVILPLFTDGDRRGLHDRASNTIVLRI